MVAKPWVTYMSFAAHINSYNKPELFLLSKFLLEAAEGV